MIIGNTEIHFVNPTEQSKDNLKKLYDTCNRLFKDDKYFYSKDELKKIKKNNKTIWI